eukprot:1134534-Rhodomonas_salina.3
MFDGITSGTPPTLVLTCEPGASRRSEPKLRLWQTCDCNLKLEKTGRVRASKQGIEHIETKSTIEGRKRQRKNTTRSPALAASRMAMQKASVSEPAPDNGMA